MRGLLRQGLWFILVTFCLWGCTWRPRAASPSQPADSGLILTPRPSPTALIASPTALPTATPQPCPPRAEVALPPRPETFGEPYEVALREYLSAGGDPASLAPLLYAWEALPPEGGMPVQRDLTGDAVPEVALTFINPLAETFPPAGELVIFTCREGRYAVLASYVPGEWHYVNLIGGEDLDGDGVADLVFADVTCGAHTCWHSLHVWAWKGNDFQERVAGEASFPYPTFSLEAGVLLVRSGGIGSVGAGPQRMITETWAWNGRVITRTVQQLGPAEYRYHAFRDGDEAFRARRYAEAFTAYSQVLNDETLDPWAGFYSAQEERLWFTALAHWRLLLLELQLGNTPAATQQYQQLQNDFTPATPGYPVAQLARRFWDVYQQLGLFSGACAEVIAAPEVPAVLDFLNSFGYANPTYAAEELCPLTTP